LFPGEEDFGIVPVEAMASGRPVLAFGRGGALDTVVDGRTGLFFHDQSVEALMALIERFERNPAQFDPEALRAHARRFGRETFKGKMASIVNEAMGVDVGVRARAPRKSVAIAAAHARATTMNPPTPRSTATESAP
jgi:glycosyltransferase involved in cell wall biosynthesis